VNIGDNCHNGRPIVTSDTNNMSTSTSNDQTASINNIPKVTIGKFGDGRYSPLMAEVFDSLQTCLGMDEGLADSLARKIASDFGAIMSNGQIGLSKVSLGKVSKKDSKLTVKEAATKVKGVSLSHPLLLLKAVCYFGEAGVNGVSYGNTKFKLTDKLADWVAEQKPTVGSTKVEQADEQADKKN